jgi:N-acetylmuramoyl-L-alanine amidase
MGTIRLKIFFLIFVGFFITFANGIPVSASLITDIRFWSAPDHTRVVLDLTEPVQYEVSFSKNPPQYYLELKDTFLFTKKKELDVNDPYLSKITLSHLGMDRVKLIFYQKKSLNANVFPLKPYLDKPHRLVIDLIDPTEEKKEEEREKQKEIMPKGTKIVVIDPGHGGEDPGAIGPHKTMEKDIVLKIGEKLTHLLNQNQEIKAFLTRKGDYFIELEERSKIASKIARDYEDGLFISLHTDGSFNPEARGSSIYCLSLSGATDEAAKILADKENLSNVLGGAVPRTASIGKDPDRDQILVDLAQTNTMRESIRFAEIALDEIKKVNELKYPTYRQANFIVLRAPKFPSVLVEIAFLTNKNDEHLLNQNKFQEQFAKSLANAIEKYFE